MGIIKNNNGPKGRLVVSFSIVFDNFSLAYIFFYNCDDGLLVVYQRVPSQYASAPQQQPPQGETSLFQGGPATFMPSGAAGMINDPMATAALQYGSHLAQSGGQLMQQNVRLKISLVIAEIIVIILQINQFVATHRFKYYFAVDTRYVMRKLGILFCPFIHKVCCLASVVLCDMIDVSNYLGLVLPLQQG